LFKIVSKIKNVAGQFVQDCFGNKGKILAASFSKEKKIGNFFIKWMEKI